jgi:Outer membrane protein beta-barrel domain
MRKLVLVLITLLAVSASAQTLDRPNRVSFFLSNVGFGWSEGGGSFWESGYGAAYERRFSRAWSAELAMTVQRDSNDAETYPFDAVVRYSFPNVRTRWRPYVGAGVRYVAAPIEPRGEHYENQLAPEIAAGVDFNPVQSWSLRFDLKQTIGNTYAYDEPFKVSIGAGWRF